MSTSPIPTPLRAVAGLAAVAIDEARRLPERLVGLPVLLVGAAMQASLKLQQQYAELVVRGDHILAQLTGQREGTPEWARFDDDEAPATDLAPEPAPGLAPEPAADADVSDPGISLGDAAVEAEIEAEIGAGVEAEIEAEAVEHDAAGLTDTAAEPPLARYDELSIPQLRARLRVLSERQLLELIAYERAAGRREPYLTMLENRLATVRAR
jgi:hypothetical protein